MSCYPDKEKLKEHEKCIKIMRNKEMEERKKKSEGLRKKQTRAEEIREKQLKERQRKILEKHRKEEERSLLVQERRRRMEKRIALAKKNEARKQSKQQARQQGGIGFGSGRRRSVCFPVESKRCASSKANLKDLKEHVTESYETYTLLPATTACTSSWTSMATRSEIAESRNSEIGASMHPTKTENHFSSAISETAGSTKVDTAGLEFGTAATIQADTAGLESKKPATIQSKATPVPKDITATDVEVPAVAPPRSVSLRPTMSPLTYAEVAASSRFNTGPSYNCSSYRPSPSVSPCKRARIISDDSFVKPKFAVIAKSAATSSICHGMHPGDPASTPAAESAAESEMTTSTPSATDAKAGFDISANNHSEMGVSSLAEISIVPQMEQSQEMKGCEYCSYCGLGQSS